MARAHRPLRRHRLHRPADRGGARSPAATARCSPARTQEQVEALAEELRRARDGGRRRRRPGDRAGAARAGRRDRRDGRPVRPLRRPGGRGRDRRRRAAIIDSTGEPAFIRRVFERYGPRPSAPAPALVTAFGYDWVPGNLAGALALREAGEAATRVDIGYFATGGLGGMSGGTRASAAGAMLEPSFAWRDGDPSTERGAARVRAASSVDGKERKAISVGASEHFTLPRIHPGLREVERLPRLVRQPLAGGAGDSRPSTPGSTRIPGVKRGDRRAARPLRQDLDRRARRRGARRRRLGGRRDRVRRRRRGAAPRSRCAGSNGYTFTGRGARLGRRCGRRRAGIEGVRRARAGRGVRARRARGRLRRGRDQPRRPLG